MPTDSKPYLEYLDKEMTIMGVLAAFAVAVPGLAISQVAGTNSALRDIWISYHGYFVLGSCALLVSALMFYRQRSLLAWYYGQICLTLSDYEAAGVTHDWLREADSWATWLYYRWAFGLLVFGFLQYGIAFAGIQKALLSPEWTVYVPAVVILGICGTQSLVLWRLRYSEDLWAVVRRFLRMRKRAYTYSNRESPQKE